jgi:energy-coupling factor transporter ATP-binding protein EcfA2
VAEPAVAVRGVRVGYGSFVVLEDVDLTVAAAEIVAVTGVNGAGKSTLLSCLAGLHRPAAGTVTVLGAPPRDDAAFWRAVTLVADQPTWYPGLPLREHLELVRLTHELVRGWCLPTDELIEAFGLPGRPTRSRPTCPPASGSGCRWRPRWPGPAGCCCSTSRSRASTPGSGPNWRACCASTPGTAGRWSWPPTTSASPRPPGGVRC